MAIQHPGGTIVNTTFTGGTRAQIADAIKDALVAAGWTLVSSSGSDHKLDSATTPQGLAIRVRVWDPGSGSCAQIRIMSKNEVIAPAQSAFLLPATGKTFRVIANKYQAFALVPGSTTVSREFAGFGVLYIPPHLASSTTDAGWMVSNSRSDTDLSQGDSWRTRLAQIGGVWAVVFNGNGVGTGNYGPGAPRFAITGDPEYRPNCMVRWGDDSYDIIDAVVGWGTTTWGDEGKKRGLLWGALLLTASYAPDTTFTFDDGSGAHTFFVITYNTVTALPGTLCVAVD